ncbi:MAG TPA: hypothetical protein VGD39_03845, partial [Nocardioides sp.]
SLGWLGCSALLDARTNGRVATAYGLVNFLLPLWALQVVVLVAAALTRRVDSLAPGSGIGGEVWGAVLTFRWNCWVAGHMLDVPPEVVGLTIFSIAAQLLTLLATVIMVLPRCSRTLVLGCVAALAALGVVTLRLRAVDFQDPYLLSLDTFARSDAFLVGVLVACLAHAGWRLGPSWSSAASLVLVGAVIASGFVSTDQYLAVQLPLVALLAGIMLLDEGSEPGDWLLQPLIGSRGVEVLAASWSALVALAPLAGSVIGRRTEMHWILRVIILLVALAIVVRVSRSVAGRGRLPEQAISLAGWGDHWRRVVAEADEDIRSGRRAHRASAPDDDDGGARDA